MRVLRNIVCVLLIGIGAALCSCGGVYAQLPTSDGTCPLPFDFMVDYSETTFGDGASHTHTYTHAFTAACIYIYIYICTYTYARTRSCINGYSVAIPYIYMRLEGLEREYA